MYAWIMWLRFPRFTQQLTARQHQRQYRREILKRWQDTANAVADLLVASMREHPDGVSEEIRVHGRLYQPLGEYNLAFKVGLALRKRPIKQFHLEYKVEEDGAYHVLVLRASAVIPPSSTREDWKELHGIY